MTSAGNTGMQRAAGTDLNGWTVKIARPGPLWATQLAKSIRVTETV